MAAYCLFDNVEVHDPTKLEQYAAAVLPIVERYDGRYVLVGGTCDVVEGRWRPTYPVMIEFPSLKHAYDWYNSEEYQELKTLRLAAGKYNAVFMESAANEQERSNS
jgi:uncharacterized protein (DUF1330 family)